MEYTDSSALSKSAEFTVTNFSAYGDKYRSKNSSIIVFVEMPDRPGPFGNGEGGILEEFAWRRFHDAPMAPSRLLQILGVALGPVLKKLALEGKTYGLPALKGKAFYSRKAGCSACPCSPGYVVQTSTYSGKRKAVWLSHEKVIQEQALADSAKKIRKAEEEFIASTMGVAL